MDDDYRKRIEAAVQVSAKKLLPKPKRKKSNDKPEAEFLLKFKKHLVGLGFSVSIIEGKANYSEEAGRYMHGAVSAGYPDLTGNFSNGLACYFEIKAPGKRATIRPAQREFLIEKIKTNCFAICVDSIEYFERVWAEFKTSSDRKALLMRELPELAPRYKEKDLPKEWFDK